MKINLLKFIMMEIMKKIFSNCTTYQKNILNLKMHNIGKKDENIKHAMEILMQLISRWF